MKKTHNFILYFIIIAFSFILVKLSYAQSLESVINSKNRTPSYVERDKYRNPLNTLSFFKLKNNMKVIELQPSGGNSPGGWYTEILAPYLKNNGLLIAAHFNPKESDWRAKMRKGYENRIKNNEDFNSSFVDDESKQYLISNISDIKIEKGSMFINEKVRNTYRTAQE